MLSAQEIANYLEKNLNEIAARYPESYQFSILAEMGRGYEGNKINGMVRTVSPELQPLPSGVVEAKYIFAVEFFAEGPSNYTYLIINAVIDEFIKANQCATIEFENGKGVVTFSQGAPKSFKVEYVLGQGVPLAFTIRVTYTENAVTSGDKHWLLDGVEIPYLSESVSVEREGITKQIYTEVYSKILLTKQTKFYTFRIPYESKTYKSLQSEILQTGAVNGAVHTLTYYDGAAFTEGKPFTAKISIYRSAVSASVRPDTSAYDITFTDVYDAADKALKYFIALIDFPFDMQGDDTRYFNSTSEQVAYFEEKAAGSSAPFIEIQAPNLDGLVITKQVYRTPAASAASQFDYVSKNYAVIKVVSAENTLYFYYFITNSVIGADGCILVDLKLDTVQTYFFNENITFSDCFIERAHLNRFQPVEGSATQVKFVTDPASKIYNSEEGFNFPKRLVKRDKLKLRFTGNDEVDNWLNENVAYWVYVFIDPTHEYTVFNFDAGAELKISGSEGKMIYPIGFNGATSCICYPVYIDKGRRIKCKIRLAAELDYNTDLDLYSSREWFEEANAGSSFYYSIKLSVIPPFDNLAIENVEIDSESNLIVKCPTVFKPVEQGGVANGLANFGNGQIIRIDDELKNGLFFGSRQSKKFLSLYDYDLNENATFIKSDITKQQAPVLAYNPKLNGQNFKELTVTAASGDTFDYDIQKLNESTVTFEYSEPITPEITKYYMRVAGDTGLYEDGTDENYTGLVGSTDNSLAYTNDQYAAFIANNKNFFLQSNMKIVTSGIKSAIGVGGNIVSGNRAAAAGKANEAAGHYGSAIGGGISAVIDTATALIDRSLTIDNLKSAPDQLKNANGNVIFNMFVTELGLYVEKREALEGDLKTANDFMNIYGFTFSSIANVRDYVHIRKYHNYIKAQLQSINGNVSNTARDDLRQRFASGIRFWNGDIVSYQYENYELWLED